MVIEFIASPVENWVSTKGSKIVIFNKSSSQFAEELGIQVGAGELIEYTKANQFVGITAVTKNDPVVLKYTELPARKYLVYAGRTFYSDENGNTFPFAVGSQGILQDGTKTFGGFIESNIAGVNNVANSLNDQVRLINPDLPNTTANQFLGKYMFTPNESTEYYIGKAPEISQPTPEPQPEPEPEPIPAGFHKMPDGSIMKDSDMYILESDGKVRLVRLGAVEYTEIRVNPDSVLDLVNRGIARLLTQEERTKPPVFLSNEVQQILLKFENNDYTFPSWFNDNIDSVKIGTINSTQFLNSFNSLLENKIIVDTTIIIEEKFCVNVYSVNQDGSISSTNYPEITADQRIELEKNQFVVSCDATTLPTQKQIQDFYNYTPPAPDIDYSINSSMVSQSIGAFILKDGRIKGEVLYIANESFNPYYYNKNITSFIQVKSKTGTVVTIKQNNLNFTETQRDERIIINEGSGNFKELIIDFFVWDSVVNQTVFSETKEIQIVEEMPPDPDEPDKFKPCPQGFHKDFSGKCVPNDPAGAAPRDKLIDTLKGFLFGTVALSLLARKY